MWIATPASVPCPSAIGECRAWHGLRRQSCPVQVEHGLTLNDGSGGVDVCVVHEQFPLILHNQVRTTDAHLTDNLTELDQGTSLDDDTGEREVSWRRHHHIRPVFDQRRLEDDMRASSNEEVLDSGDATTEVCACADQIDGLREEDLCSGVDTETARSSCLISHRFLVLNIQRLAVSGELDQCDHGRICQSLLSHGHHRQGSQRIS